jgi:hypothetical protein
MNLSAIFKIPDQATRNLMYAQALEMDELRAEIAELKQRRIVARFRPRGGDLTLETAFKKVT